MKSSQKKFLIEWGRPLFFAILFTIIIKTFIFAPFVVEGASMQPTLKNSDRLFVNKISLQFSSIQREDVVVIKNPNDPKYYVKRVIGLSGDTIEVVNGILYINGKEQEEKYLDQNLSEEYKELNYPKTKIPEDKLFVMGDNRLNSKDSRTGLGDIDLSSIVGKTEFVFYPFDRIQVIN